MAFLAKPAFAKSERRAHPDVWLKNEQADRITPGRNAADPYSPRRTCGTCHGYTAVTSGYHFRQGIPVDRKKASSLPATFADAISVIVPFSERLSSYRQEGIPLYDWIGAGGKIGPDGSALSAAAGWFHPGGGILEYGRNADGTLDLSGNLITKEARRGSGEGKQGAADLLSRYAPDRRSHFRESGALEADCLICHMDRYRMEDRNREIQKRNYRWAATAGAGVGKIDGAVFSYRDLKAGPGRDDFLSGTWNFSKRPIVRYEWDRSELFTADGRLKGKVISGRVRSQNCLRCHGLMEAFMTGSDLTRESDVHAKAGFQCTDCHLVQGDSKTGRLSHQFAGKRFPGSGNQSMQTCKSCHLEGRYRRTRIELPAEAKRPAQRHARKLPRGAFHLYVISCEGCHAAAQARRGGYLFDMSSGDKVWYAADNLRAASAGELGSAAKEAWRPWIERIDAGQGEGIQYAPCLPRVGQWFGKKSADGSIHPLSLSVVREAVRGVEGRASNDKSGRKTIGSPEEISRALSSLQRKGYRDAVFVADAVYQLKGGKLEKSRPPAPALYPSSGIHHNIVPLEKRLTLGSKGCLDCHGKKSEFFVKMKVINAGGFLKHDYPNPKEPNSVQQMKEWGFTSVPSAMPAR